MCAFLQATEEQKRQFTTVKHIANAARIRRQHLESLIPPNVLKVLATHDESQGILATNIEQCTVMFCSLVTAANHCRPASDFFHFQELHSVYLAFDEVVSASLLYKYQVRRNGDKHVYHCSCVIVFQKDGGAQVFPRERYLSLTLSCYQSLTFFPFSCVRCAQHVGPWYIITW